MHGHGLKISPGILFHLALQVEQTLRSLVSLCPPALEKRACARAADYSCFALGTLVPTRTLVYLGSLHASKVC